MRRRRRVAHPLRAGGSAAVVALAASQERGEGLDPSTAPPGVAHVERPQERAQQRQCWLEAAAKDPRPWVRAAIRLEREYPELAALEPDLISQLVNWKQQQKALAKGRRRLLSRNRPTERSAGSGSWRGWGIVVFIAFTVLRFLVSGSHPTTTNQNVSPTLPRIYREQTGSPNLRVRAIPYNRSQAPSFEDAHFPKLRDDLREIVEQEDLLNSLPPKARGTGSPTSGKNTSDKEKNKLGSTNPRIP